MISKSHAVFGLAALICSTVLMLGLVDREPERPAPARPATALVQLADPDTDSDTDPSLTQPADEPAEGSEPATIQEGGATPPVRTAATRTSQPSVRRRICRVTAYCDRGITASGVRSGVGQCAAPRDVPFGSKIYIPSLRRTFVVTDRTHPRFRHNTVDIFIPSERKCFQFGRSYLECHISPPPKASSRLVSR